MAKQTVKRTSQAVKKKPLHHRVKHRAKLLVVPHKHNQYQPHLVRGGGLLAVILLVFAVQAFYNFSSSGTVLGGASNVTSEALLKQTNKQRKDSGLSTLTLDSKLSYAATMKANDMFKSQYWAHTSPSGVTPWKWFKDAEYSYSYAGENLAKNFTTTDGVIAAWMASSEHRQNILDANYTDIGFAVVPGMLDGQETKLVVALYGAPKQATGTATAAVLAAQDGRGGLLSGLGERLQSMTPAALASILVLLLTALVASTAHMYRKKLPKPVLKSWRRHHGLYKAFGMASLAVLFVGLYGGGQI